MQKPLFKLSALAAVALGLAACGGGDKQAAQSGSQPATTQAQGGKNLIYCSLTATASLIPAVWALPAILACWWMSQRLASPKNVCAVNLNHCLPNLVRSLL